MLANVTATVAVPLHNVWLAGCVTTGNAFTVTLAVIDGPAQPPNEGIMVNVVVPATAPVLTNVPEILPVPEAAMPVKVAVLSLVQL